MLPKMKKMKYPKLPIEKDRRYKILPKDRVKIIKLYESGINKFRLAKIFNISYSGMRRIVDEDYKQYADAYMKQYFKERYKDINFRKYCIEKTKSHHKYKKTVNDDFRNYTNIIHRQHPDVWQRNLTKRMNRIKSNPILLKKYREYKKMNQRKLRARNKNI